jgi:hypothetical protein
MTTTFTLGSPELAPRCDYDNTSDLAPPLVPERSLISPGSPTSLSR